MHSVLGAQKGAVQPDTSSSTSIRSWRRKQLDDADNWLQTLEKTAPNHFDTVRLRAEYQFLRGNYKAAGDLAMAFLDNPDAQPKDRGQQLLLVAQVMEKFSDRLKAEGKQAVAARLRREGRHALCFPAEQESPRRETFSSPPISPGKSGSASAWMSWSSAGTSARRKTCRSPRSS